MNDQGIHLICSSWGAEVAKSLIGGWQGENILSKMNRGGSGGIAGHCILAGQMSPDQERVNRGYKKLSEKFQVALAYKYVYPNLPLISDTELTNDDLAKRLSHALGYEVPKHTFLKRVRMAKDAIKKSEFRY